MRLIKSHREVKGSGPGNPLNLEVRPVNLKGFIDNELVTFEAVPICNPRFLRPLKRLYLPHTRGYWGHDELAGGDARSIAPLL